MSQRTQVEDFPSELRCWRGQSQAMSAPHRHDDVEVNLVTDAELSYLFGPTRIDIGPGQAAVFWAAVPHQLIDGPADVAARVRWLHVPLSIVLRWNLPAGAVTALLRGHPLITEPAGHLDVTTFDRWTGDLAAGSEELAEITLLEIQAALRRLLRTALPDQTVTVADAALQHVAAMAGYVERSFADKITVADVAAVAHLHPNYAMSLFRQVLGVSMRTHLVARRIAEAQRLLRTTDLSTSQIAGRSGFGSVSGFYAAFGRVCGQPPADYRRAVRAEAGRS